jgi:D-alanyl-D-alanine carboxypeptidase/D-alanyl-D-alanine-endopeptidase (penicillin-binding protein 4)
MTFVNLLSWYYNNSENYGILKQSFPEPGSEGTLRYYFKDPVFAGRVFIKSGSMTGVQCYSGYLLSESGKILAICIMINNFTGSNQHIINYAEEIIRETILNN